MQHDVAVTVARRLDEYTNLDRSKRSQRFGESHGRAIADDFELGRRTAEN